MAAAREKDRTKDWKDDTKKPEAKPKPESKKPANPLGDPDVISGVKRGEPMDRTAANEGHVNPDYGKVPGSTINCQSCVVAFEARLRGYDVTAKPNHKNPDAKHLSGRTYDAWIDPATGKPPEMLRNVGVSTKSKWTWKDTKNWLEENVESGNRYTFQHMWKGRSRSGHIISVDRDSSGNLRLYDPQTSKTYTGADADAYIKRTKGSSSVYGFKLPDLGLTRVDNMRINPQYANGIMEGLK